MIIFLGSLTITCTQRFGKHQANEIVEIGLRDQYCAGAGPFPVLIHKVHSFSNRPVSSNFVNFLYLQVQHTFSTS